MCLDVFVCFYIIRERAKFRDMKLNLLMLIIHMRISNIWMIEGVWSCMQFIQVDKGVHGLD